MAGTTAETVIVSVLGGIGTGLVGLVALFFQHRFIANSEQISTTIRELEQMVDSCGSTAITAWSEIGNPSSANTIATVCQLHAIAEFVRFITDHVPTSQIRLNGALVNFRRASSGDQFDVKDRPADAERALEIHSAAARLKIALRTVDYDRRKFHLPFTS